MRNYSPTIRARLEKHSMPEPNSGCILWLGSLDSNGYGQIGVGADADGIVSAHIASYETAVGPVPQGLELDHKCRVRCCINPLHLEPVTHRENMLRGEGSSGKRARQTHCKNDHPLSGENLKINKRGHRSCRTCCKAWQKANREHLTRQQRERRAAARQGAST
jgi:hypothetical protein